MSESATDGYLVARDAEVKAKAAVRALRTEPGTGPLNVILGATDLAKYRGALTDEDFAAMYASIELLAKELMEERRLHELLMSAGQGVLSALDAQRDAGPAVYWLRVALAKSRRG